MQRTAVCPALAPTVRPRSQLLLSCVLPGGGHTNVNRPPRRCPIQLKFIALHRLRRTFSGSV